MGEYAMIREFNVSASLTFLDVNKASNWDRTCYDSVTNSSLMDDPANTSGESLWFSSGIQVLPIMNGMIDIKSLVPIWIWETGTNYSAQLVSSYGVLLGLSHSF
jgi:hypothetical protein